MMYGHAAASADNVADNVAPLWATPSRKYAYAPGGEKQMTDKQHLQLLLALLLSANKHTDQDEDLMSSG